jgi:hypothetical protein
LDLSAALGAAKGKKNTKRCILFREVKVINGAKPIRLTLKLN